MGAKSLPTYDCIAIDEIQDFSILSVRLLLRLRNSDSSHVFLSGDENQKIYQRDFTWKQLDEGLRGYTITLHQNMRNTSSIRHFSDRLLGTGCPHDVASNMVYVADADEARTIVLLRRLADPDRRETTALITGRREDWRRKLRSGGIQPVEAMPGSILSPGIYVLGDYMGKGLEFDNVVVDYAREASDDAESERRLRYVHFTRARRRLYVRYQGQPPELLTRYYSDFLG